MINFLQEQSIKDAAFLLHHVKHVHFTPSFAIFAVSQDEALAKNERAIEAASLLERTMVHEGILNQYSKKERVHFVLSKAKALPKITRERSVALCSFNQFGRANLANAMRLVGYTIEETTGSTAAYRAALRHHRKESAAATAPTSTTQAPVPPTAIQIETSSTESGLTEHSSSISPLSSSVSSSQCSSIKSGLASKPSSSDTSSRSAFAKLTDFNATRRNVFEKQEARAEEVAWTDVHETAYKVGSIILSQKKRDKFPLKEFNTAEKIATRINECFGAELICGNELNKCVNAGRAGRSPPRQGKPRRITEEDFQLICELVFTCQSIEQSNCDINRLNRPQMTSAIHAIVNDKLERDGGIGMNAVHLYNQIQKELSRKVKLSSPNYREAIRAAWLTWDNQRRHYENWEKWVLEMGFARLPKDAEERAAEGYVVFDEEQRRRIIQFDEMGFSFDGSKNGKGGRPAMFTTNPEISDPQQQTNKCSHKVTCMYGINFAHEAVPPLFVLMSAAANPKAKGYLIRSMKHVEGKFGWPEICSFPPALTFSKDGSIDKDSLLWYIEHHLCVLYPDAQDVPGKRVLMKADSGPGRFDETFLCVTRSYGFYFYPGLPNGTELGQEMDQLFGFTKSVMEWNRDKLWRARAVFEGSNANTTAADLAWVVFGGKVTLENDDVIELRNAFAESFSPRRLQRATTKCGYVPATRVLLESEVLIQQLYQGEDDSDSDSDSDSENSPHEKMLKALQKRNHLVVDKLRSRGYSKAVDLERNIAKVKKVQQLSDKDVTKPNTKGRQDRMMKASKHAGEFYRVSDGGAPMNCDDMIIVLERKRLEKKRKDLEKEKRCLNARQELVRKAKAIVRKKGKEYNPKAAKNQKGTNWKANWTVDDLKTMIKWKSPDMKIPTDKAGLEASWDQVKHLVPPSSAIWNEQMESELKQYEAGGVKSIERTFIMRETEIRKKNLLLTKISALQQRSAYNVIGCAIQSLPEGDRKELLKNWKKCKIDDDCSLSSVSSESSEDSSVVSDEDDTVDGANGDLFDSSDESDSTLTPESPSRIHKRVSNRVQEPRNYSEVDQESDLDESVVAEESMVAEAPNSPQRRSRRQQKQPVPHEKPSVSLEKPPPIRRSARQRNKTKK